MSEGGVVGFFEVSRGALRRAKIRAGLPTVHPETLDEIEALVGSLPDPGTLCAEERAGAMAKVAALTNQLQAYLTSVAGAADANGDSRVLGAGTTGTLVATATGATVQAGSAIVQTAAELRSFPELKRAFDDGRVSSQHVSVVLQTTKGLGRRAEVVDAAVALAAATDPRETRHVLQVIADAADGEHGHLSHAEQRERRSLRLTARPSGMWRLTGLLDDVEGARLAEVLEQFSASRDAGVDAGETLGQRRADALAAMAQAAHTNRNPLGTSGLSVLIDADDLPDAQRAMLTDGTPITADSFDLLTCTMACLVIFGTKTKGGFAPLAMGRTRRRATGHQWGALIARDRGCVRCGRSPRFCEAHHVLHWRHGGLTDVDNMVLLCSRCHHDLHHGRFTITMTPTGVPELHVNRGPPADVRA
ncbi:MAG: DUF222 domain-containing protein [Actinobacteria bacterium]|nr:DUF222 domain-containing protein [Actinomycetota bacterium]